MRGNATAHAAGATLLAALLCTIPGAMAAGPVAVKGKAADKAVSMEPIYQNHANGRFVFTSTNRGVVRSDDSLFDGAERQVRAQWDLTQGSGMGHGFITMTKGGDSWSSQWNGTCTTLLGEGGKPQTQCAGGWISIPGSGSGRYAGLTGGGSWSGDVLPNGDFEGGFEGQYVKQ